MTYELSGQHWDLNGYSGLREHDMTTGCGE